MERLTFALSVVGVLFAGYLSSVKFFSSTCAFGESCPYFLGYPACYYGLAMYLALAFFAAARLLGRYNSVKANSLIMWISGIGIAFSGYFTALEVPVIFSEGLTAYVMGLPTCALGLIMYVVIFALAWRVRA